jgi:hypothetical protein
MYELEPKLGLIQKQPLCLFTGGDVLARPFVVEWIYMYNNNYNNEHPTQQISNCLREENWWCHGSCFAVFWQLFCFNNSPDCSSWIMVSEVSKCVCVCVCVSLSLFLSLFCKIPQKIHPAHTTVNQPAASDFHFKLAANTWGYVLHQCYVVISNFLKNLAHSWVFWILSESENHGGFWIHQTNPENNELASHISFLAANFENRG